MDETYCDAFSSMMGVLYYIHDNDWPQETALYPYCVLFGCNPVYCAGIGL